MLPSNPSSASGCHKGASSRASQPLPHLLRWSRNHQGSKLCFFTRLSTIWLFNIAMENCPFIDSLPIKWWFSMATLNTQRVGVILACICSSLLVGGIPTPLKNMSSSVGMMIIPNIWKVIKFMFQTTNQITVDSWMNGWAKPTKKLGSSNGVLINTLMFGNNSNQFCIDLTNDRWLGNIILPEIT